MITTDGSTNVFKMITLTFVQMTGRYLSYLFVFKHFCGQIKLIYCGLLLHNAELLILL